jgi:hypothetical protein
MKYSAKYEPDETYDIKQGLDCSDACGRRRDLGLAYSFYGL